MGRSFALCGRRPIRQKAWFYVAIRSMTPVPARLICRLCANDIRRRRRCNKGTILANTGLFNRLVSGGACASIVAAAGMAWLCGAAGAIAVVTVAAGWLAFLLWHDQQMRRETAEREEQTRAHTGALVGNLGAAFAQCAGEFNSQLATSQGELDQAQGLFMDAIQKLVGSFTSINAQAQSQQKLALTITQGQAPAVGAAGQDDGGGFEHFVAETS